MKPPDPMDHVPRKARAQVDALTRMFGASGDGGDPRWQRLEQLYTEIAAFESLGFRHRLEQLVQNVVTKLVMSMLQTPAQRGQAMALLHRAEAESWVSSRVYATMDEGIEEQLIRAQRWLEDLRRAGARKAGAR